MRENHACGGAVYTANTSSVCGFAAASFPSRGSLILGDLPLCKELKLMIIAIGQIFVAVIVVEQFFFL